MVNQSKGEETRKKKDEMKGVGGSIDERIKEEARKGKK